jgi:hypothetical protein
MTPPTQYAKCGRILIAYQVFDRRAMGLSDRDVASSTLEERGDDIGALMDAIGSERAALLGVSEGGYMAQVLGNCVSNANGGGCAGDRNCGVITTTPPVLESILDISSNEGTR